MQMDVLPSRHVMYVEPLPTASGLIAHVSICPKCVAGCGVRLHRLAFVCPKLSRQLNRWTHDALGMEGMYGSGC